MLLQGCKRLEVIDLTYCNALTRLTVEAIGTHCRFIRQLTVSNCRGMRVRSIATLAAMSYATLKHAKFDISPSGENETSVTIKLRADYPCILFDAKLRA